MLEAAVDGLELLRQVVVQVLVLLQVLLEVGDHHRQYLERLDREVAQHVYVAQQLAERVVLRRSRTDSRSVSGILLICAMWQKRWSDEICIAGD